MIATTATRNAKISIEPPPASGPHRGRRVNRTSAPCANTQARRGPLLQHLTAEAELRSRPAAGLCRHDAGRFDQRAILHKATEVLLVQQPTGNGFHGPL